MTLITIPRAPGSPVSGQCQQTSGRHTPGPPSLENGKGGLYFHLLLENDNVIKLKSHVKEVTGTNQRTVCLLFSTHGGAMSLKLR